MRIPEFKITDEKTKAALIGYLSLLTKDQSRTISSSLAEIGDAIEKGDLVSARKRVSTVASSMVALMKAIDESVDLLGLEDPSKYKTSLQESLSTY